MVGLVAGHELTAIALPGPTRLSFEAPCSVVPPCLAAPTWRFCQPTVPLGISSSAPWRFRLSTAKPCLRIVTPRLICHAFFPLKAKLLELWTAVSPAAREVFDLVALKEVRRCAVEVQI